MNEGSHERYMGVRRVATIPTITGVELTFITDVELHATE